MEKKNTIGANVRLAREALGLSQVKLGNKIGKASQHISYWEIGKFTPDSHNLLLLSKALQVSVDFFHEHDPSKPIAQKPKPKPHKPPHPVSAKSFKEISKDSQEYYKNVLGANIKRLRNRIGKTQADIGKFLGVDYRHVGSWERGETFPEKYLNHLAFAFGVELWELFVTSPGATDLRHTVETTIRSVLYDIAESQSRDRDENV